MKYSSLFFVVFLLLPVSLFALVFDPPLNDGIEFPDTRVDQTSTVEFNVRNNENIGYNVLLNNPQNQVFSVEPNQQFVPGGQAVVFEITFAPDEVDEFNDALRGEYWVENGRRAIFQTSLSGNGIEAGDPVLEIQPEDFSGVEWEVYEPWQREADVITLLNNGEGDLEFGFEEDIDWLEIDPNEGVVEVDDELDVLISMTDWIPDEGEYEGDVRLLTNDPERAEIVFTATLSVNYQPQPIIVVEPGNVRLAREARNERDEVIVTITNIGERLLELRLETQDNCPWLDVQPLRADLESMEELEVHFATNESPPDSGEYSTEVTVVSNDPDNDEIVIEVILDQLYQPVPVLNADRDPVQLEITEYNTPVQAEWVIGNTGERTLEFELAVPEVAWLNVEPTSGEVLIEQETGLTISATTDDLANGEYQATINVTTNDRSLPEFGFDVLLTVNVAQPEINVDPLSVDLRVEYPEIVISLVNIVNNGDADLNFTLEVPQLEYAVVFPVEGVLAPDESLDLTVASPAEPMPNGEYPWQFSILSNDPVNDMLIVEVNLVYDINSIDDNSSTSPSDYSFSAAYPNPFNSSVRIAYELDLEADISLKIFDLSGREVAILSSGISKSGKHNVTWDASGVPSGIYLCRLESGERVRTLKLTLVR